MFIIRAAFWLLVVAILIPTSHSPAEQNVSGAAAQELSAQDAVHAAFATAGDVTTFCSRNPDVCVTGVAALNVLEHRARNGFRTMYHWATAATAEVTEPGREASLNGLLTGSTQDVAAGGAASQSTLRIDDIIPEWSGPDTEGDRA